MPADNAFFFGGLKGLLNQPATENVTRAIFTVGHVADMIKALQKKYGF